MIEKLPAVFRERLEAIFSGNRQFHALESLAVKRNISVRINTLRISVPAAAAELQETGLRAEAVPWCPEALVLQGSATGSFSDNPLVKEGKLYIQSLSSMLPAVVLGPESGDNVLDLCAAPGSKTGQMAAMMKNEGLITAVESVRPRMYKLKSVLSLLGVSNVTVKLTDGRRYRPAGGLFDKILVDAPCSSEGRFNVHDKKTFQYWSLRKIKEMVRKQRGLLLSASRLLKPGATMVYSTCTFAPEENEGVVDWLLKKCSGTLQVVPITVDGIKTYPAIRAWEGKTFNEQVSQCLRVLPDEFMEGFFITKFTRL